MLDKRKIRLMTRAAIYEKRHGEEDLKVSGYYKKDYTSLNTWITIMRLFLYAAVALGAYLVLVIIYGIGAGNFYSKKHARAKQRVKRYMRDISRLEKMNNKKEKNRS